MQIKELLLVGNPNAGKSTFFNQVTGLKQHVGNFPGITVEKKQGQYHQADLSCPIIDLPGVYSLMPQQHSSQDERVTLDYLLQSNQSVVINVVDATALERHLYLTMQLRELGLPMLLVLNKWDLAQQANIDIDVAALSAKLNCTIIKVNANKAIDLTELTQLITSAYQQQTALTLSYSAEVETLLTEHYNEQPRFQALLQLVEQQYQQQIEHDVELDIASVRYQTCHDIAQVCVIETSEQTSDLSDAIDNWLLKPWLAIPAFLFAMYLMFMFAINIGGAFIDFFDIAVGALLVDGLAQVLTSWQLPEFLVVVLTDGVGAGIQTVSTFIPLILCLYLFLTFLEQSGYLARAAVVTDRLMQKIGLPGSAFVPLMMGFGCTVPAVMATRTLKQKRERILSTLMSHFMVCGARLPVCALFAAAFFSDNALTIVFSLYLLGIVAAIFTGLIMRKTLLKGEASPFIIELPQYQWPSLSDLANRTWQRLKGFVFGAGRTIVIVVTILGVLNSVGKDGSLGNAGTENSLLSSASQIVTPVFKPMGIDDNNWQATVGIFTGLFAKEVLVASLNSLYQTEKTDEAFDLSAKLKEAVTSIADHFAELSDKVLDPLGIASAGADNVNQAASSQDVSMGTLSKMTEHFHGKVGAFSYLLFILLYAPCASAMGAIAREHNGRWALLIAFWSTLLAYTCASLFYQTFAANWQWQQQGMISAIIIAVFLFIIKLLNQSWLIAWLDGGKAYVGKNRVPACH